ncbi:DUF1223 domain-containing protein [Ostreiculturibacter nitratireducens]|uniref:DUF1223 domain-containing protein n=1 Tax=Ostreiculturibacter nitratireducens TaxID=3075226 RepID=UPI0031B5D664
MRRMMTAALGLWLGCAGISLAQDTTNPVVVELYTSQGCSSCPPADALLAELAPREDVIALALHVDYWDYIGWKDSFAAPEYTMRQKAYARAVGARSVYTPQIVVQGQEHLVGLRPMELADLIRAHGAKPSPVRLTLERAGGAVRIRAEALGNPLRRELIVQLVRYTPEEVVEIMHGENAGRRITYANIVTSWQPLGEWDGAAPLAMEAPAEGDGPTVVILQEEGPGPILAAARLR